MSLLTCGIFGRMDSAQRVERQEAVSITKAAAQLGVSRQTIYRMIEDGRLQATKRKYVKRQQYRITAESLEALQRQEGDAPPS